MQNTLIRQGYIPKILELLTFVKKYHFIVLHDYFLAHNFHEFKDFHISCKFKYHCPFFECSQVNINFL
jgi:hypothetical protein